VYARAVNGRTLYVNANWQPVDVPISGAMQGVLGGKRWDKTLKLDALGVELLEPLN
jgi:beta-galactosidase